MDYLFTNKDLRKLIIPLVFEQTLAITVGMADTMMISSVGEAAISGVSLVDMVNNLIFCILAALATGGAVVTSQRIGAKDYTNARKSAKQLLYAVIIFSLFLTILVFIFRTPLLKLFFGSIEDDVMQNALIYFMISAVSFPFLAIYNACAALFRSMGNSQITLKVSILMNIINVVGNAFCIFILKMGVAGVAIPSLISRAFAGVALYILLRNPKHIIHFDKEPFRLDFTIIRNILYIGIPSGLQTALFAVSSLMCSSFPCIVALSSLVRSIAEKR